MNKIETDIQNVKNESEKLEALLKKPIEGIFERATTAGQKFLADNKTAKDSAAEKKTSANELGKVLILLFLQGDKKALNSFVSEFETGRILHPARKILMMSKAIAGILGKKEFLSYTTKRGEVSKTVQFSLVDLLEFQQFPESFTVSTAYKILIIDVLKAQEQEKAEREAKESEDKEILERIESRFSHKFIGQAPKTLQELKEGDYFSPSALETILQEVNRDLTKEKEEGEAFRQAQQASESLAFLAKNNPEKMQELLALYADSRKKAA